MPQIPVNKGRIARPACMGKRELGQVLKKLDLDDPRGKKAGEFLRIHDRTVRRWLSGDSPVDARTAMLLKAMVKYKITPQQCNQFLLKRET